MVILQLEIIKFKILTRIKKVNENEVNTYRESKKKNKKY